MLSRGQLFATPWTVAHQAPLSMEFSSQEYWSGLPFPLPGNLPHPGTEPVSAVSPALAGWFFTTEPPGNLWVNLIKAPLFHQIEGFEKAESNVCFSLPMYIWYLAVSAWYIVVRYNIDLMNTCFTQWNRQILKWREWGEKLLYSNFRAFAYA